MSYLVLARKYRPQTFQEMVGQEHIKTTLQNALKLGRIAHAYLFSGPRGVGKTTLARLLAKALNCKENRNSEPCNKCVGCQEITAGNSVDVIEIDGASNRGIDEIRTLRENVQFRPAASRYKIYIIDEVHMLTTEAFNALLKTLEEPPSHGLFIFATTEPQRVPNTILSRCQRYPFRLLLPGVIKDYLVNIVTKENIAIDEAALDLISTAAQGSLRDALGFLDQVIAFSPGKITGQLMQEMLGLLPEEFIVSLSEAISGNKTKELLALIEEVIQAGYDPFQIADRLRSHFRSLLLSQGKYLSAIELLSQALVEMRWSDNPRIILETKLVRLSSPKVSIDEIINRLENLEKKLINPSISPFMKGGLNNPPLVKEGKGGFSDEKNYSSAETVSDAKISESAASVEDIPKRWSKFLETVNQEKTSLYTLLLEGKIKVEGNNLEIGFPQQLHCSMIEKNKSYLEKLWEKLYGDKVKIQVQLNPDKTSLSSEEETAGNEPVVKKIVELFHGKINPQ